jgi:hypothetical protein
MLALVRSADILVDVLRVNINIIKWMNIEEIKINKY